MIKSISQLLAFHSEKPRNITATIADRYARIREWNDPAIFISLKDEEDALKEAKKLANEGWNDRPLYGVPIAVKDNIDVAGFPTTAACPKFSYEPRKDSTAVARLRAAGAIVIGKTNLDQFATGLVGVRTPYGIPRNAMKDELVPGGSSSGSAIAVAAGLVPLALGTDTAGSGRVPAGMNNIVGIKPSLGLISTSGVVPACRSLDCVSIFALSAEDAFAALKIMAGFDETDAYSRELALGKLEDMPAKSVIGIPRSEDILFFGDEKAKAAFALAISTLSKIGAKIIEFDISSLLTAARLLYEGPWVAERYAAVGEFIEKHKPEIDPTVREIILGGLKPSAVDAFRAFYKLQAVRGESSRIFGGIDALMVPTNPAAYMLDDLAREPIKYNSNLGTYTNFVNLLDLAGIAVPYSIATDGTPYGVTFLGRCGEDASLASIGRAFHAATNLMPGIFAKQSADARTTT